MIAKNGTIAIVCFMFMSAAYSVLVACPPPDCGPCASWNSQLQQCVPKCDDSGNVTTTIAYNLGGLTAFADKIESAIESIKVVDIDADVTFALEGELNHKNKCCDICDDGFTSTVWGSTGLSATVEVSYDLLNIPDLIVNQDFWGKGSVSGKLEFDLEPIVTASGSGGVDGIYVGCDAPCWNAEGNIMATLGGQIQAVGDFDVKSRTGWEWFDGLMTFKVKAEATANISIGAMPKGFIMQVQPEHVSKAALASKLVV